MNDYDLYKYVLVYFGSSDSSITFGMVLKSANEFPFWGLTLRIH